MRTRKLFEPSPALAPILARQRESPAGCVRRGGRLPHSSVGPALPSEPRRRDRNPPCGPARPGTPSLCETADRPRENKPSRRTTVSGFPNARCALLSQQTDNDPSAGSPTETLLRLLLPLNTTVWSSSRRPGRATRQAHSPRTSLKCSIGSSDGRCVQRAGT